MSQEKYENSFMEKIVLKLGILEEKKCTPSSERTGELINVVHDK